MASGKQILLELLKELSQQKTNEKDLSDVTDKIRAGLLLHGSTASYMWPLVEGMDWISRKEEGKTIRQGLGLTNSGLFLSELFDLITWDESIPESVLNEYPEIDHKAAINAIRLILTSVEWSLTYMRAEEGGMSCLEKEELINSYVRKLAEYRKNPNDYS